ncbi:NUDIX domain-containing protein [Nakamurella endophytica]|uniref:Hypothetical MutT/nudix family protein n=1 Tax=Nakamurella endophytica TaxID=1748367 RepID=A0A917SUV8_9ACTN|nr:NUDIX hydrolase [Nakamurella endophytica]GGL97242.1 hypothetical MutT/nudix family protein [Nakamurella endophytica]
MAEAGVTASEVRYDGAVVRVREDTVERDGSTSHLEVVEHADSVAVLALDTDDRVLLIRHDRHPAGGELWELPAGLRDRAGEDPVDTARREPTEETGWAAARWSTVVDLRPSPGVSTETCRVYRATDLSRPGGAETGGDEAGMPQRWVPVDDAVAEVLDGRITSALAVAGLLALAVRRASGVADRPAAAPWPSTGTDTAS